jgi:hypothetical protein
MTKEERVSLPDGLDLTDRAVVIEYALKNKDKYFMRDLRHAYRFINGLAPDEDITIGELCQFDWTQTPLDLREQVQTIEPKQKRSNILSAVRKLMDILLAAEPSDAWDLMQIHDSLDREYDRPKDARMRELEGRPIAHMGERGIAKHGNIGKESKHSMLGERSSEQAVKLAGRDDEYSPTLSTDIIQESSLVRRFLIKAAEGSSNVMDQASDLANSIYRHTSNVVRWFTGKSSDKSS